MTQTPLAAPLLPGLLAALLLAACAGAPPRAPDTSARGKPAPTLGQQIASSALAQLGRPYRLGGNGPDHFDCSGLVRYAHAAQGIDVPRTTAEQLRKARPVALGNLAPGDVLFFRFDGPKVSHVALYTGNGRFVHAPQGGRSVESRSLDEPWYRNQLVGAGRLH